MLSNIRREVSLPRLVPNDDFFVFGIDLIEQTDEDLQPFGEKALLQHGH